MLIFFLITLGNIITVGKTANLLIAFPQYLVVLYLLFNKHEALAMLLHHAFIITCVSSTNVAALLDNPLAIYSYSRLKLVGPIGVSYVVSILICLMSLKHYRRINRKTLFYKLFLVITILAASGYVVGFIGLLVDPYYSFSTFTFYGVYIFIVWINMFSLLLNYNDRLVKKYYEYASLLIISGVLASFVGYAVFGIVNVYGNLEIILQSDIVYFAPVLIVGLLKSRNKIVSIVAIALYLWMSLQSINGKGLVITVLGIFFLLLNIFFYQDKDVPKKKSFRNKMIAVALIAVGVVFGLSFDYGLMFSNKVHHLTSLFSGNMNTIDESPFIRVATTMNIWDNYVSKPWKMIVGMGYGGYFTDSLGLFRGFDLVGGGWPEADVASGHFTYGHDTFAAVPLFNGFAGLIMLFVIVWKYIKRIKNNYFAFAAIPWLLLTFYFSTQLAISGIFLLFASEFIDKKNPEKHEVKALPSADNSN